MVFNIRGSINVENYLSSSDAEALSYLHVIRKNTVASVTLKK